MASTFTHIKIMFSDFYTSWVEYGSLGNPLWYNCDISPLLDNPQLAEPNVCVSDAIDKTG